MSELTRTVQRALTLRGHLMMSEASPPKVISLEQRSTAVLATLTFSSGCRRIVVKKYAGKPHAKSSRDLFTLHERLRSSSPVLAAGLPQFLGYDDEDGLILMEHLEGHTLLDAFKWERTEPSTPSADARQLLDRTAAVLTELHRLRAVDLGMQRPDRPNAVFLQSFERALTAPELRPFIPNDIRDPECFYALLAPGFFDRSYANVLPVDAQPRNVLITEQRGACLIDLDYSFSNPAQSVAGFLVGFDQVGMRLLTSRSRSRLRDWKQAFLRAYLSTAPPAVFQDLTFFYPWMLLQAMNQHLNRRPWLRPYLIRYYGRRLHAFLTSFNVLRADTGDRTAIPLDNPTRTQLERLFTCY